MLIYTVTTRSLTTGRRTDPSTSEGSLDHLLRRHMGEGRTIIRPDECVVARCVNADPLDVRYLVERDAQLVEIDTPEWAYAPEGAAVDAVVAAVRKAAVQDSGVVVVGVDGDAAHWYSAGSRPTPPRDAVVISLHGQILSDAAGLRLRVTDALAAHARATDPTRHGRAKRLADQQARA